METLITSIDILILGLLFISPALILIILKRLETKWTLIKYSIISSFVLGILMLVFAWWSDKSDLILLKHYGYNIDGMNYTEFYGNVSPDNMEKMKRLETNIMGIGWPLKAFFGYLIFSPYFVIVYIGHVLIKRLKKNANAA